MKIFILNPLIIAKRKSIFTRRKRQPLSLAYIASLLRGEHQIKLLDANALDLQINQVLDEINKFFPDILILTSSSVDRWECPHSHIDSVFEIINHANIENIILTGSHGTVTPDWIFNKCKVKYIVRGEPEMIVDNLVKVLGNKQEVGDVQGISFRKGKEIIHNENASRIENLDQLPLPAYDLLPMEKYHYSFNDLLQPFSIILTSRGCPFQCIYCLKAMAEGKYIARSPESVINEIKYLIEKFGVKSIYFQDWEFIIDKERVKKICDLIIKEKIKIIWGCNSRADNVSEDLVKTIKRAGCVRINIGFESGCQKVLDKSKKMIKIQDLENALKICRENEVNVGAYSLLNLPGEDRETIKETVEFLKRNQIKTTGFNLVIPYFGTELFEQLKRQEKNIFTLSDNDKGTAVSQNLTGFSWDNIESFAGRVGVKQSPFFAKLLLRHYKFKINYGKFYFLNLKVYLKLIRKILKNDF